MPGPIAVHPSGNLLYLGRILPSKISVLDLLSETVSTNVTLDDYPTSIVIDPSGTAAYVVSSTSIKKIDVYRNTVTAEFSISDNPTAIAIEPSGRYAYVTNGFLNTVSKIDLTDFTEVGSVRVGEYPNSIAIDSSGQIAFVISGFDSTLSKIDKQLILISHRIKSFSIRREISDT
jgi:YVTN family beta-propeller protein